MSTVNLLWDLSLWCPELTMKFILAKEEAGGICQNPQTQKPNLLSWNGPGWQFLWCISFKGDSLIKKKKVVWIDINFLKDFFTISLFISLGHSTLCTNCINMWSNWLMHHTPKCLGTWFYSKVDKSMKIASLFKGSSFQIALLERFQVPCFHCQWFNLIFFKNSVLLYSSMHFLMRFGILIEFCKQDLANNSVCST